MLNSMKEKTPVGVGDQCVELTLAERGVHALRLIGHITETLVIHTPEFRDQAVNRGLFSKEGDAGVHSKKEETHLNCWIIKLLLRRQGFFYR